MFEQDIIDHAESNPREEVCGFILLENDLSVRTEPTANESPVKERAFSISPLKFLNYKLNKTILGIYHSHPVTSETPSKKDKALSEEMGIPYLIYSIKSKKFFLYYPKSFKPPSLTGRPYVKGFYECTCMLKDYFAIELKKDISQWNKNYWLPEEDKKANKLLRSILTKNTIEVDSKNLQKHDIIVFEVKKNKRFHVGIYMGGNEFVHQPDKILSKREFLEDRWQNKIKQVHRHKSLV